MTAASILNAIGTLHAAGLRLAEVRTNVLGVVPKSLITGELRDLIRANKDALIGWLHDEAANDPTDSHSRAMTYGQHHFSCPPCIAGGQGYGRRCGIGAYLWARYCESLSTMPAVVAADKVGHWRPHEETEVGDEQ